MKRKKFLETLPLAGLSFGMLSLVKGKNKEFLNNRSDIKNDVAIEKVKRAMLSLQRATWEQGVAMQSMLELGETELVILMAKDAVLRQSTDGRLAMLGEEFALSDAASPGEAVLYAAKETGDSVLMNGFNKLLDYILNKAPRTKDGIIYHFSNIPQI